MGHGAPAVRPAQRLAALNSRSLHRIRTCYTLASRLRVTAARAKHGSLVCNGRTMRGRTRQPGFISQRRQQALGDVGVRKSAGIRMSSRWTPETQIEYSQVAESKDS